MSANIYKFSVFMAVLFLLIVTGESILCHQCNSFKDDGCYSLDNNSTRYLKECNGTYNGSMPFCKKIKLVIEDQEMVRLIRSCGWMEDKLANPCYAVPDSDYHMEIVCNCREDGCNSAPSHLPHKMAIATILILIALLK